MGRKNNSIYLEHVIEACEKIESRLKDVEKTDFLKDEVLQDSIIRQLEIVGEATKNLSSDFRKKHQEINWKDITGTRDVMIHDYFYVKLNIVWETATKDVPELKKQIEEILDKEK